MAAIGAGSSSLSLVGRVKLELLPGSISGAGGGPARSLSLGAASSAGLLFGGRFWVSWLVIITVRRVAGGACVRVSFLHQAYYTQVDFLHFPVSWSSGQGSLLPHGWSMRRLVHPINVLGSEMFYDMKFKFG